MTPNPIDIPSEINVRMPGELTPPTKNSFVKSNLALKSNKSHNLIKVVFLNIVIRYSYIVGCRGTSQLGGSHVWIPPRV